MAPRLAAVFLVISCSPAVDPAAHRALGERVDHLQNRLDALERQRVELEAQLAAREIPPAPGDTPARTTREVLTVRLLSSGVEIDGRAIADERLDDELRAIAAAGSTSSVLVDADQDVEYARVVALLDRIRSAGFDRLAIASKGGKRDDAPAADDTTMAR